MWKRGDKKVLGKVHFSLCLSLPRATKRQERQWSWCDSLNPAVYRLKGSAEVLTVRLWEITCLAKPGCWTGLWKNKPLVDSHVHRLSPRHHSLFFPPSFLSFFAPSPSLPVFSLTLCAFHSDSYLRISHTASHTYSEAALFLIGVRPIFTERLSLG